MSFKRAEDLEETKEDEKETCECDKKSCNCKEKHGKKEKCDCGCDCKCDDNCTCEDECEECCCDECNCEHSDQMQEAYNYLEMAQRIQAEFDNYRKRTIENEKIAKERGIIMAVEKILPIVDSIESAKKQVSDENFIKAIDLISNQISACFEGLGVKKIEALDKPFNPNYHNAIMTGEEKDKESDIILEVFQEGFMLNDKVIRHSVVKVNK